MQRSTRCRRIATAASCEPCKFNSTTAPLILAGNKELAAKIEALEQKTELLALQHDTFSHNTRAQLKQVFEALRQLMAPPPEPPKRPIGFVTGEVKKAKSKG